MSAALLIKIKFSFGIVISVLKLFVTQLLVIPKLLSKDFFLNLKQTKYCNYDLKDIYNKNNYFISFLSKRVYNTFSRRNDLIRFFSNPDELISSY